MLALEEQNLQVLENIHAEYERYVDSLHVELERRLQESQAEADRRWRQLIEELEDRYLQLYANVVVHQNMRRTTCQDASPVDWRKEGF